MKKRREKKKKKKEEKEGKKKHLESYHRRIETTDGVRYFPAPADSRALHRVNSTRMTSKGISISRQSETKRAGAGWERELHTSRAAFPRMSCALLTSIAE